MVEKLKINIVGFLWILILLALFTACANRSKSPVMTADSAAVYPSLKTNDIEAGITLFRKINKKTGEYLGEGSVFTPMENENVRAFIKLNNVPRIYPKLMFHFDWIDAHGISVYQKHVEISNVDSVLKSSISLSPGLREPGKYTLRLYYFRERIAEKEFEILPQFQASSYGGLFKDSLLNLIERASSGFPMELENDSLFIIRNKVWLDVNYTIKDRRALVNRELLFRFDWIDPDGNAFYRKNINIAADDSSATLSTSISITPDKREPGNYAIRLYLFDEIIAEKNFELQSEANAVEFLTWGISASIRFYNKKSKKTGKYIGEGTQFARSKKGHVRAVIDLNHRDARSGNDLHYTLEWIGPDGNSFYKKQISLPSGQPHASLNSSISISPKKRKAGTYKLRLSLYQQMISEKTFELKME